MLLVYTEKSVAYIYLTLKLFMFLIKEFLEKLANPFFSKKLFFIKYFTN